MGPWPTRAFIFVFLGVQSDLRGALHGSVELSVTEARINALAAMIEEILDEGRFPPGVAASFCGKLQFTLSWVGGRVGRACMQPLFHPASDTVTPPIASSLRFLLRVLPGLPPHDVQLDPSSRPPALVFSDGACEGDGRIQDIGFVVAIPRSHARPLVQGEVPSLDRLARDYDIRHGAAALPLDLRDAFVARKT